MANKFLLLNMKFLQALDKLPELQDLEIPEEVREQVNLTYTKEDILWTGILPKNCTNFYLSCLTLRFLPH